MSSALTIVEPIARRAARSADDAADITSEVMVALVESEFGSYDPALGPLSPWLWQATTRRAASYYRSVGRRKARELAVASDSTRHEPVSELLRSDVLIVAHDLLAKSATPAPHRAAVLLRLVDYTFAEIAADMASVFGIELTAARWSQILRPILATIAEQLSDPAA